MKPKDILPDEVNSVEKDGVIIRKGTIGAFTENIRIIESSHESERAYNEASADLLRLIPALQKLRFFDFYSVKSARARKLIQQAYPTIRL